MSTPRRAPDRPIELLGIGPDLAPAKLDLEAPISTTSAHGLTAYWRPRVGPRRDGSSSTRGADAELDDTLAFAEAIGALHRRGDLLPARVGTGFTSSAALRRHLDGSHARYAAALERIRGCTEIALRIALKPPLDPTVDPAIDPAIDRASSPPHSAEAPAGVGRGRAYLLARRLEERRREALQDAATALAEDLHGALAGIVREQRAELALDRQAEGAVAIALLIERSRLGDLRSALTSWLERGDHRGVAEGPLAPYSFVDTDGGDESPE